MRGDASRRAERAHEERVERRKERERDDEHDGEVQVDEVGVAEARVRPERRVLVDGARLVGARVDDGRHAVLEHARHVVEDGEHDDRSERGAGAAPAAARPRRRPQRPAHRGEPLDREADRRVDAARLRDERRRVGERHEVRVEAVVGGEPAGRVVDDRQRHEEDKRDEHDQVEDAERHEVERGRRAHAPVGEDDDREDVADDAERRDDVADDAPRVVLEEEGVGGAVWRRGGGGGGRQVGHERAQHRQVGHVRGAHVQFAEQPPEVATVQAGH